MTCNLCGRHVEACLRATPGVGDVLLDWQQGLAEVEHDATVSDRSLSTSVERASLIPHRFFAEVLS
jgi:copper chaperone CopZ